MVSVQGEENTGSSPFTACNEILAVSTDQAHYGLVPGSHYQATEVADELLAQTDALVLESGVQQYEDATLAELAEQEQYSKLLAQNQAHRLPVFLVDLPFTRSDAATFVSEFGVKLALPALFGLTSVLHLQQPLSGLLAVPALSLVTSGKHPVTRKAASYAQISNAYNTFGLRSAVAAAKLEQFVTDHVTTDDGQKPAILVDYGAGHLDIGAYLRHPTLRKRVLQLHERLDYPGIDDAYLDKLCAFRYDDGVAKRIHSVSF